MNSQALDRTPGALFTPDKPNDSRIQTVQVHKSRERPTLSSLLLKDMFQVLDGIPIPILMCSSGISAKLRLLGLLHLSLFTVLF